MGEMIRFIKKNFSIEKIKKILVVSVNFFTYTSK